MHLLLTVLNDMNKKFNKLNNISFYTIALCHHTMTGCKMNGVFYPFYSI